MIRSLAVRMAKHIHEQSNTDKDVNDIFHGIQIVLNFFLIISITLAIALLLGTFKATLLAMAAFLFIRSLTGGIHLSAEACIIVSVGMLIATPYLSTIFTGTEFYVAAIICFIMVLLFSPYDLTSEFANRHAKTFKITALIFVAVATIAQSPIVLTACLFQCLLLNPIKKR